MRHVDKLNKLINIGLGGYQTRKTIDYVYNEFRSKLSLDTSRSLTRRRDTIRDWVISLSYLLSGGTQGINLTNSLFLEGNWGGQASDLREYVRERRYGVRVFRMAAGDDAVDLSLIADLADLIDNLQEIVDVIEKDASDPASPAGDVRSGGASEYYACHLGSSSVTELLLLGQVADVDVEAAKRDCLARGYELMRVRVVPLEVVSVSPPMSRDDVLREKLAASGLDPEVLEDLITNGLPARGSAGAEE